VTKEEESGERVIQVGVDFVCREIFRQQVDNYMECNTYFFEFVEVRFTLVVPQLGYVFG
jgi:hypothetical protein